MLKSSLLKGSDQKHSRKRDDAVFPVIILWELHVSVAMETRVLIRSGSKPIKAFPPMTLQIKFHSNRPTGCRDIQFESVNGWTHRHVHTWTSA